MPGSTIRWLEDGSTPRRIRLAGPGPRQPRAQGVGSHLESREVGSTAAQAHQVHIANSCLWKHGARERRCDVKVVGRSCPRRELELASFEADHTEGDHGTRGFRGCSSGVVESRCLRPRVKRDVDHGPEVHSVVLLESERCQRLVRSRRIRHMAGDELENRRCAGRCEEDAEVGRVHWVRATARRLTIIGAA